MYNCYTDLSNTIKFCDAWKSTVSSLKDNRKSNAFMFRLFQVLKATSCCQLQMQVSLYTWQNYITAVVTV